MTAYLCRTAVLYPFFTADAPGASTYVGTNSVVTIETASVEVEGGDLIFVFSRPLQPDQEELLLEFVDRRAVRRGDTPASRGRDDARHRRHPSDE